MRHWALDLGTTNTALAGWDDLQERPVLLVLPRVCRDPDGSDPMTAPGVIPSATQLVAADDVWSILGRVPLIQRRAFWGRQGMIGREALEHNISRVHPSFAPSFKAQLQHQAVRPLVRLGRRSYSTREVARVYLRELLAEVKRTTGIRIRDLTVTTPVDAYEGYRAELAKLLHELGVTSVQFADEPIAAAAGYGLSVRDQRTILVVDFGGGTLDLALVRIDARSVESGTGRVLAKSARPIGGDVVDRWLLQHVCRQLRTNVPDDPFWARLLLDEARRVKECLLLTEEEPFHLRPPGQGAPRRSDLDGRLPEHLVHRDELQAILETHGLYRELDVCTDEVLARARSEGLDGGPDDVLMVGGSTLLPGVFPRFERRFGRDKVRAWQPFEAVVQGACTLAARGFAPSDYIVHEYAILISDPETGERRPTTIVPAGTRFPTAPDLWRSHLVPTCALGEPERVYKLIVCEIGRAFSAERSFGWDESGKLHQLDDGGLVVPLNEANPAMGFLDPPHLPEDRSPRLDVRFGVNAERWLTTTVVDLKTRRTLMDREPVVRLL